MATLSLAMIVKNEERTLGRVLEHAQTFCDELVVVDTGSSDATRDIAAAAGAIVVDFPWIDDFAAARNASFAACTQDWIIWLDADDAVPPAVQEQLRLLKLELDDRYDAVWITYQYHFDGSGTCTRSFPRERILRRAADPRWTGAVHEVVDVPKSSSLERLDLSIQHRPYDGKDEVRKGRNLRILEKAHANGDRSPRTLFYLGNELRDDGQWEAAQEAYLAYLAASDCAWERHSALMSLSMCANKRQHEEEAEGYLYAAVKEDPARAEAFVALGRLAFNRLQWARALPWFAAAAIMVPPSDGFVHPQDYSWVPLDHIGVCLINMGRYAEGIAATVQALEAGHPDVERLRANIIWAADRLG